MSQRSEFWKPGTYVVVGDSTKGNFPFLTYHGLNQQPGWKTYAVDPGGDGQIDIESYLKLSLLPETPDTAILEVPKEDCILWVEKCVKAGVKRIWIHMHRESEEAIDYAKKNGVSVEHGSCALLYVGKDFPGLYKLACPAHIAITKLLKKY